MYVRLRRCIGLVQPKLLLEFNLDFACRLFFIFRKPLLLRCRQRCIWVKVQAAVLEREDGTPN